MAHLDADLLEEPQIFGEEVVAEVKRVIEYPKFSRRILTLESSSRQGIAYLMNLVMHVPSPEHIPALISEDPSDDLFIALAVQNQACLIVSGDQHLLALKEYKRVPLVTPEEAVGVVKELLAQ